MKMKLFKVLIPLFRSFIFTKIVYILFVRLIKPSFNPFIQVFYFYIIVC